MPAVMRYRLVSGFASNGIAFKQGEWMSSVTPSDTPPFDNI